MTEEDRMALIWELIAMLDELGLVSYDMFALPE